VPLDRLLVETDAPYLAPVPFRGKRNEPAWVTLTLEVLARERGMAVERLQDAVLQNYDRLFGDDRPQVSRPQGLSGSRPR
jgi:TatD DNase family protein